MAIGQVAFVAIYERAQAGGFCALNRCCKCPGTNQLLFCDMGVENMRLRGWLLVSSVGCVRPQGVWSYCRVCVQIYESAHAKLSKIKKNLRAIQGGWAGPFWRVKMWICCFGYRIFRGRTDAPLAQILPASIKAQNHEKAISPPFPDCWYFAR